MRSRSASGGAGPSAASASRLTVSRKSSELRAALAAVGEMGLERLPLAIVERV